MKHIISFIVIIIFIFSTRLHAQNNRIPGEYSLNGIRETASGIQLNEDSTFRFYFTYGALDRYGSGTWSTHEDQVIFDSKPYPGKDFKLVKSSFEKNNVTTIKIEDKNTNLYSLVYCMIKRPAGDTIIHADSNGIIIVPSAIDSIHFMCGLCTERTTYFTVKNQKYNSYTFNFEPWITEVFFKSFTLRYSGDQLQGKHPLLGDKEYIYKRENAGSD